MRQFTVKVKTIKVNERDYKQLLRRFGGGKARLKFGYYNIAVSCICNYYGTSTTCGTCPFSVFKKGGVLGCAVMLKSLKLYPNSADVGGVRAVSWDEKDDAKARKEIQAIREFILSWEKVKKCPQITI